MCLCYLQKILRPLWFLDTCRSIFKWINVFSPLIHSATSNAKVKVCFVLGVVFCTFTLTYHIQYSKIFGASLCNKVNWKTSQNLKTLGRTQSAVSGEHLIIYHLANTILTVKYGSCCWGASQHQEQGVGQNCRRWIPLQTEIDWHCPPPK